MQQQERLVRAALRHHGLPHHRRRRGALLPGARRCCTAAYQVLPRPLQGLHLDAQAERLPLAAHRRDRPAAASASRCRSAPREMHEVGRARRRRPLALQAGRAVDRRAGNIAGCASCSRSSSKAPDAEEFLEHTKLEMFQDQVFCFTPKGELIALPRGATPIDFAYAVHTQVGDTCVGAKINGRMLPLRTQLQNGDQVEIVTSQGADAVADLGALRRHRQGQGRDPPLHPHAAARAVSRSSASRCSRRPSTRRATRSPRRASTACKANFKQATIDDLIAAVGAGLHRLARGADAVYPGLKQPRKTAAPTSCRSRRARSKAARRERGRRRHGQIADHAG